MCKQPFYLVKARVPGCTSNVDFHHRTEKCQTFPLGSPISEVRISDFWFQVERTITSGGVPGPTADISLKVVHKFLILLLTERWTIHGPSNHI